MRWFILLICLVPLSGCGAPPAGKLVMASTCMPPLQEGSLTVNSMGLRVSGEDPLTNPVIMRFPWSDDLGRLKSVDLTVNWTPSSPATESLWMVADLFTDRAFQTSPSVEGRSPLSLSVYIQPGDELRDMAWLDFMSSDGGLTMASIAVDQEVHVQLQETYGCS